MPVHPYPKDFSFKSREIPRVLVVDRLYSFRVDVHVAHGDCLHVFRADRFRNGHHLLVTEPTFRIVSTRRHRSTFTVLRLSYVDDQVCLILKSILTVRIITLIRQHSVAVPGSIVNLNLFTYGKPFFMLVFLEADLDDVAEKLRHHTAKTTRIEMGPWAKAYTVDIKDIYTELSLEKIENQPTGPEGKRIEDYKELFAECGNELQEQGKRVHSSVNETSPLEENSGEGGIWLRQNVPRKEN